MGYHKNCFFQNCAEGCCNEFGVCPSSTLTQGSSCKYYYGMDPTVITGIVGGILGGLLLIALIAIICLCIRVRKYRISAQ